MHWPRFAVLPDPEEDIRILGVQVKRIMWLGLAEMAPFLLLMISLSFGATRLMMFAGILAVLIYLLYGLELWQPIWWAMDWWLRPERRGTTISLAPASPTVPPTGALSSLLGRLGASQGPTAQAHTILADPPPLEYGDPAGTWKRWSESLRRAMGERATVQTIVSIVPDWDPHAWRTLERSVQDISDSRVRELADHRLELHRDMAMIGARWTPHVIRVIPRPGATPDGTRDLARHCAQALAGAGTWRALSGTALTDTMRQMGDWSRWFIGAGGTRAMHNLWARSAGEDGAPALVLEEPAELEPSTELEPTVEMEPTTEPEPAAGLTPKVELGPPAGLESPVGDLNPGLSAATHRADPEDHLDASAASEGRDQADGAAIRDNPLAQPGTVRPVRSPGAPMVQSEVRPQHPALTERFGDLLEHARESMASIFTRMRTTAAWHTGHEATSPPGALDGVESDTVPVHGGIVAVIGRPGVGRTTVVAGLAVALGRSGASVAAVDAARPQPRLGLLLGAWQTTGFREALHGAELDWCINGTPQDNVDLLASGVASVTGSPLPDPSAVAAVIRGLAPRYDWVVVDLPGDTGAPEVTGTLMIADFVVWVVDGDPLDLSQVRIMWPRLAADAYHVAVLIRPDHAAGVTVDRVTEYLDLPVLGEIPEERGEHWRAVSRGGPGGLAYWDSVGNALLNLCAQRK